MKLHPLSSAVLVVAGIIWYFVATQYILSDIQGYLAAILGTFGLIGVHALLVRRKLTSYGFVPRFNAAWVFTGLGVMFFLALLGRIVVPGFDQVFFDRVLATVSLSYILIVVLAAVFEEFLFRGLLQSILTRYVRIEVLAVVLALVFSSIHLAWLPVLGLKLTLSMVASAFLAGVVLILIFHRSRSLLSVVLIHAITNLLTIAQIWIRFNSSLEWLFWLVWGWYTALVVAYLFTKRHRLRNLFK